VVKLNVGETTRLSAVVIKGDVHITQLAVFSKDVTQIISPAISMDITHKHRGSGFALSTVISAIIPTIIPAIISLAVPRHFAL